MSQQFREIDCVARRRLRGARHRLLRLVKVLEVPAAHRFVVPTGGALGRDGETVVVEHLEQISHDFVGAALVSYRALCRAPTAGVTDGLEQQSRRARRTCRVNTPTVPPFNETRDLHWFNTIEVIPCVTVPQGCAQVDRVGRICIVGLRSCCSARRVWLVGNRTAWSGLMGVNRPSASWCRHDRPRRSALPGSHRCSSAHLLCFP
jgi:hypothetical protein